MIFESITKTMLFGSMRLAIISMILAHYEK